MKAQSALRHFGYNQSEIARALGVTQSAISQWPDVVPIDSALAVQVATGGKVAVDYALYPRLKHALRYAKAQQRKRKKQ
jgi:DNA-binding transcriptional regulator YdaS (Cro superfamily)